jgi:hypothetical protein
LLEEKKRNVSVREACALAMGWICKHTAFRVLIAAKGVSFEGREVVIGEHGEVMKWIALFAGVYSPSTVGICTHTYMVLVARHRSCLQGV